LQRNFGNQFVQRLVKRQQVTASQAVPALSAQEVLQRQVPDEEEESGYAAIPEANSAAPSGYAAIPEANSAAPSGYAAIPEANSAAAVGGGAVAAAPAAGGSGVAPVPPAPSAAKIAKVVPTTQPAKASVQPAQAVAIRMPVVAEKVKREVAKYTNLARVAGEYRKEQQVSYTWHELRESHLNVVKGGGTLIHGGKRTVFREP